MSELESVVKRLERLEVQNQRVEAQNQRLTTQNRRLKLAGIAGLLACAGVVLMGQDYSDIISSPNLVCRTLTTTSVTITNGLGEMVAQISAGGDKDLESVRKASQAVSRYRNGG